MQAVCSKIRILAIAIGMVLGTVGLTACSNKPESPVNVGTDIWTGFEPGYLAERRGLFGDADVTMRQMPSATEVLRAFRNQSIDIAAVTMDEALLLANKGTDIRIILVTDISNGGDAIMARPGIASVKDLAGKRVGVENSALGDYVLGRALQLNGLTDTEITQVPLTVDETVDVYQRNAADAVVTFDPFKTHLARLGARQIFDSSEIPGEIVDVLIVRKEFADANPNAVKAFVAGWLAASDLIAQREPAAMSEVAGRLDLSTAQLLAAMQELNLPDATENRELLAGVGSQMALAGRKLIPMLERRNKTRFTVQPDDLITPDYLPEPSAR